MSINKKDALNIIRAKIEDSKLITIVDRNFLLEKLSEEHAYLGKGHKRGNVVIQVTPEQIQGDSRTNSD
jgi:hypothetical protein